MNTATTTLELPLDLAQIIKANATARQKSLDQYLREMVEADRKETDDLSGDSNIDIAPTPNYAMLEALRRISERSKDMPYTSGEDTQRILREARAGAMFGYEPTE